MFFTLPLPRPGTKVNIASRVVAKMIDLALVIAVGVILPYPVGPLLGFFYSLFADGLPWPALSGQSIGKKLMKLRVISITTQKPAGLQESALRNAPVGVATFFAIIPVWGWLILFMLGVPLMIFEIYLMLSVDNGRRWGDVMGETEVIEVATVR